MEADPMDVIWPWLLATLVFVLLVGSGRTLRGEWVRPAFGGGVAVSAALGVMLFSLIFVGLGHFGALRSPWPLAMLGLAAVLALPGLLWTWRDWRQPARGLERGFGPRWYSTPIWILLVATLLISMVWLSGVFGWEGRGLLFEQVGVDYELGRIDYHEPAPRDPHLAADPLRLWLYGLGSVEAALALSWWLGVAVLYGVCGLGWRLHSHGTGLTAAALLALVLFVTDRPLFLAPAMPATLALLAVMVLAVESRGRPHAGRSIAAGALAGFALISDFGSGAMLLALLVFGPLWSLLDRRGRGLLDDEEGFGDMEDRFDDEEDFDDEELDLETPLRLRSWCRPVRHLGYGAIGLSLPLLPWLGRSYEWTGDAFYGCRPETRIVQHDERLAGYEPELGLDVLDDYRVFGDYLTFSEWGMGIGTLALLSPLYSRFRRTSALNLATSAVGYTVGGYLGDWEVGQTSAIALGSVSAGATLEGWSRCPEPRRTPILGGSLTIAGLGLGVSTAYDCGYWRDFDEFETWQPRVAVEYEYNDDWRVGVRYLVPRVGVQYDTGFDTEFRDSDTGFQVEEPPLTDFITRPPSATTPAVPEEEEEGQRRSPGYTPLRPEFLPKPRNF